MSLPDTPAAAIPAVHRIPARRQPWQERSTTAALAEPKQKVTARWVTGLVLVNVGINAAFFGPINIFIAQQAIGIDEPNKEAIASLVLGAAPPCHWWPIRSSGRCPTGRSPVSAGVPRGSWPEPSWPRRHCWRCPEPRPLP